MKLKELGWDVRPIAVGEVLRRLAGKCACALTKEKATDFFAPFQFGVACPGGTEKIIHRLRQTVEDYWLILILQFSRSTYKMHLI